MKGEKKENEIQRERKDRERKAERQKERKEREESVHSTSLKIAELLFCVIVVFFFSKPNDVTCDKSNISKR